MCSPADNQEHRAFGPFLAFLARDIEERPEMLHSFTPTFVRRVRALTAGVEIDLDVSLSLDDSKVCLSACGAKHAHSPDKSPRP
ncbi:type II toxin-antitoxin system PrlF family antitoxin [Trinickia dinghuensis]|uniref:type II toxin-antitoxin system PrlF family antitoxin n=1 Tax=Trinickia dinghuensis TaxID=2291023 RepID=UPI0015F17652